MNDNELPEAPYWASRFVGEEQQSLLAALSVLAGLIESPTPFKTIYDARLHMDGWPTTARVTARFVLSEVCEKRSVKMETMLSKRRTLRVTLPRQEAYFRIFTECPHMSYPEIGRLIGGRDHTTVLHGVQQHCFRLGIPYEAAKAMRETTRLSVGSLGPRNPRFFPYTDETINALSRGYGAIMERAFNA